MINYMFVDLLDYIILIGMILVGTAYLTLLERKLLSYIQFRKGPNKVGLMGLLQPFSDGIKLFMKESLFIHKMNLLLYYFCPVMLFLISLILWTLFPYFYNYISNVYSVLFFFCLLSLNIYPLMIMSWSSNSLYSSLGSLRSISQTISYEISLILLMLSILVMVEELNFFFFIFFQKYMMFFMLFMFISFMLFVSFMAELNRTPFDLIEGESELVSGFNIEYMSGGFALIFLSEYGNIMFLMMIFGLMFFNTLKFMFFMYFSWSILLFMVLWIRGVLPRIRYDQLMYMVWLNYLPISLNFLILYFYMKYVML
uniref:NADH dehydrogenase subunit 1 n=1 Tax=Platygaster robiniae TaxID=2753657 RepID=UPI002113B273|nr:NADH dehydrogenase subunit 1 [Platygaster robiniae]UTI38876.1 NADH dehydrogenase subunit 1 [Platygaster robiniae]